jgi:hypothetical protein
MWHVEINWGWGGQSCFREVESTRILKREELPQVVESFVRRMTRRYTFDCGRLEQPLHPWIGSIRLTEEREPEWLSMDDLGLGQLLARETEWTRTLIENGRQFVNGNYNNEPAPKENCGADSQLQLTPQGQNAQSSTSPVA